ncbi:YebC/PmpR family DNA-binding transcriptional regulator [Mesoterricola silvestris]|uniref:Probable transcriptional regulatory protein METEAL_37320 n=1 Tax=Mesoterricola silvestris TaxID=2927979 RepID=A0AA48KDL3_9BACT|nr:YebC/PmpR family DNA-binding transcriptional regulator [Mesoterricola silvestris]BDU74558.1 putative transcriptional regulatory protein [Mesoterricola silvestris]
MSGHSKWSTIKHKKGAADAKRGKVFTRILKEITVAARLGGGDVGSNPRLRLAVDTAKGSNMPKDNWERAIKKGTGELEGVTYEEVLYEGYGPGGVAIIVEALTDNKNRTTPEIRSYFSKFGNELGAANSVSYMFTKQGEIVVDGEVAEDTVMEVALEAGADDVQGEEGAWIISTDPAAYQAVKDAVDAAKLPVLEAKIIRTSAVRVDMNNDKLKSFLKLIDLLEDNDDVQNVWTNADYDEPEE